MLHVFSTNRVKLVARTPTTAIKKRQREYVSCILVLSANTAKCYIHKIQYNRKFYFLKNF